MLISTIGAAKIKAFVRQTKHGIDFRLRRKLNAEHEEVTDIQMVANEAIRQHDFGDEKHPSIPELPATLKEISELPDTSTALELDAVPVTSRTSTGDSINEPLPRYEPRRSSSDPNIAMNDNHQSTAAPLQSPMTSHRSFGSRSSIIATPRRSLSLDDPEQKAVQGGSVSEQGPTVDASNVLQVFTQDDNDKDSKKPANQLIQQSTISESLQTILAALQEQPSALKPGFDETPDPPSMRKSLGKFKIANTRTYETETEAEASPPIIRKASSRSRKTNVVLPKRRKKGMAPRSISSDDFELSAGSDDENKPIRGLLRMQTIPKRLTASSGAEALWSSLIKSQANLLGAEHPLVYQVSVVSI